MRIQKQAINDAHELFFYYDEFWKLRDNVIKKGLENEKYKHAFSEAYYPMVDSLNRAREVMDNNASKVVLKPKFRKLKTVALVGASVWLANEMGWLEPVKAKFRNGFAKGQEPDAQL